MTPSPDDLARLTVATAHAVKMLLRRELAEHESIMHQYGESCGTPPRDVKDALDNLESALKLAGEAP